MRRREFLRVASGAAGASAVGAGTAAAQESPTPTPGTDGTATGTETGASGSGATVEVALVDFAFEPGTDDPLVIPPGTTVRFVWETSNHNIVVESQPEGADWEGYEPVEDEGFTYEHTFTTTGDYHYFCQPHQGLGMVGDITVEEGAPVPGAGGEGGGVPEEVDPEEMGVPYQAHFVGLATMLMVFISFVFTFFLLKYGETPHSGYPKR
jgi:plastocyanin